MAKPMSTMKLQLLCLRLGGRLLFFLFFIGWIGFADFVPAPSPMASAAEIARRFHDNRAGIQIGATFMMLSFCFWAPWGAVVAAWTKRAVPGGQVLAYVQIVSMTIAEMVGVLCAFFWAVAAFRPGEIDPQITMTLNDMAWLMFLLPWPPFSMWCIAVALAVYRDRSADPVLPRWTAYLSLLTAFLFMPAGAALFFKVGGYAYNGLLGMYLPLAIFFVWVEGVTYAMVKRYRRDEQLEAVNVAAGIAADTVGDDDARNPAHV